MNAQEIFNTVARHLFTQGERAAEMGNCKYRSGKLKCAVGALIPDEAYDPRMDYNCDDGTGVRSLVNKFGGPLGVLPEWFEEHQGLLQALQYVHDRGDSWDSTIDMRDELIEVANRYNLDIEILDYLAFEGR